MSISPSQKRAVQKYKKKVYDSILLTVPKGKKDVIKRFAEVNSLSMNQFINTAIEEKMKRSRNEKTAPE